MDWMIEGTYTDDNTPDIEELMPPFFGHRYTPLIPLVTDEAELELRVSWSKDIALGTDVILVDASFDGGDTWIEDLQNGQRLEIDKHPPHTLQFRQRLYSSVVELYPEDRLRMTYFEARIVELIGFPTVLGVSMDYNTLSSLWEVEPLAAGPYEGGNPAPVRPAMLGVGFDFNIVNSMGEEV